MSDAPAANTAPPRPGHWICAVVDLADGRRIELRIPAAVAGSISTYTPRPDENPAMVLVDQHGQRRRARLGGLFNS